MREVNGLKIAFVDSESYFEGFHTPSMVSTARSTGADMTILLAPGKTGDDVTDEMIREMLEATLHPEQAKDGDVSNDNR